MVCAEVTDTAAIAVGNLERAALGPLFPPGIKNPPAVIPRPCSVVTVAKCRLHGPQAQCALSVKRAIVIETACDGFAARSNPVRTCPAKNRHRQQAESPAKIAASTSDEAVAAQLRLLVMHLEQSQEPATKSRAAGSNEVPEIPSH
jgi:hypothetical protein